MVIQKSGKHASVLSKSSLSSKSLSAKYFFFILDTNVIALCIATREAIQNMKSKGTRGHIIHLNSIAGHEIINFPKANVYGASKYAVTALTMTLINDLANEQLPIKVTVS